MAEDRGRRLRPLDAPQQGADARRQLLRAERLDDVVVGAQLEPAHAIRFLAARGEHDDWNRRHRRVLPQRLTHQQPVHARQHEVQQDQIRRILGAPPAARRGPT
jgi:hypothetical protein